MTFYIVFAGAVATFGALIYQDLYIINEETLIGLIFVAFMLLVYDTASDLIRDSLDERATLIMKEFDAFFALREQALELLISYHNKQVDIASQIASLIDQGEGLIQHTFQQKKDILLNAMLKQQKSKLASIAQAEAGLVYDIQQRTTSAFSAWIYRSFKDSLEPAIVRFKEAALADGIRIIKQRLA